MIEQVIQLVTQSVPPSSGANWQGFLADAKFAIDESEAFASVTWPPFDANPARIDPSCMLEIRCEIGDRFSHLGEIMAVLAKIWSEVGDQHFRASSCAWYKEATVFRFVTVFEYSKHGGLDAYVTGSIVVGGGNYAQLVESYEKQAFARTLPPAPSDAADQECGSQIYLPEQSSLRQSNPSVRLPWIDQAIELIKQSIPPGWENGEWQGYGMDLSLLCDEEIEEGFASIGLIASLTGAYRHDSSCMFEIWCEIGDKFASLGQLQAVLEAYSPHFVMYNHFRASSCIFYKEATVFRFVTVISNDHYFVTGRLVVSGSNYSQLVENYEQQFGSLPHLPSDAIADDFEGKEGRGVVVTMPLFVCFRGDCDNTALVEARAFSLEDTQGRNWICFEAKDDDLWKMVLEVSEMQRKFAALGMSREGTMVVQERCEDRVALAVRLGSSWL